MRHARLCGNDPYLPCLPSPEILRGYALECLGSKSVQRVQALPPPIKLFWVTLRHGNQTGPGTVNVLRPFEPFADRAARPFQKVGRHRLARKASGDLLDDLGRPVHVLSRRGDQRRDMAEPVIGRGREAERLRRVGSAQFLAQNLGQGFAASTMMLLCVAIILIPWAYLEFGGKRRG